MGATAPRFGRQVSWPVRHAYPLRHLEARAGREPPTAAAALRRGRTGGAFLVRQVGLAVVTIALVVIIGHVVLDVFLWLHPPALHPPYLYVQVGRSYRAVPAYPASSGGVVCRLVLLGCGG